MSAALEPASAPVVSALATQLVDRAERARAISDFDANLLVEASAGCGKTSTLAERVAALILAGRTRIERIVVLTFTDKAAAELKSRIRRLLLAYAQTNGEPAQAGAWTADAAGECTPEGAARARIALRDMELAFVGTLHAFCADLLRMYAEQAALSPLFVVLDARAQRKQYRVQFARFWRAIQGAPPPGIARVLSRRGRDHEDRQGAKSAVFEAGLRLVAERDALGEWARPQQDRHAALPALLQRLAVIAAWADRALHPDDILAKAVKHVSQAHAEIAREGRLAAPSPDAAGGWDADFVDEVLRKSLRGYSGKLWTYRGYERQFAQGLSRDDVVRERDALRDDLLAYLSDADADLAALLAADLQPLVAAYSASLAAAGAVDFLDLPIKARALLARNLPVRAEVCARYTHILVDEFQDLDPLQAEIVAWLGCANPAETQLAELRYGPGKVLFVGDPKQSIYRFRRAGPEIYARERQRLLDSGGSVLALTHSFRALAPLQQFVNAAFGSALKASLYQSAYSHLEGGAAPLAAQPCVVALPVPAPYSDKSGKVSPYAISQSLPAATAAYVRWLIEESGYRVRVGAAYEPLAARHIALLFRRASAFGEDVVQPYVRALELQHVPCSAQHARASADREELVALETALTAIEWPHDELAVLATLKGPFFGVSDESLLVYRDVVAGPIYPLSAAADEPAVLGVGAAGSAASAGEHVRLVQGALCVLAELHRGRMDRTARETLARLFEATRALAGVAFWPNGDLALANLERFLERAGAAEDGHMPSLRALLAELELDREEGSRAELAAPSAEDDGVQCLTVHRAKGLEFPVVVLCDLGCPDAPQMPSSAYDFAAERWVGMLAGALPLELRARSSSLLAGERAEALRVGYVAATRARDMLVVPVVGEGYDEGWLRCLGPALYPEPREFRASVRGDGLPAFGAESCRDKPPGRAIKTVMPGVVRPRIGEHSVVFWDPCILQAARDQSFGVRQQRLLAEDSGGVGVAQGEAAFAQWAQEQQDARQRGARNAGGRVGITDYLAGVRRSAEPQAAPGWAARAAPCALVDLRVPGAAAAPLANAAGIGSLVHALLAAATAATPLAELTVHARVLAPQYALDALHADACAARAAAVLGSAWMARVECAELVRRECPIECKVAPELRLVGTVDLAYLHNGQWTIAEYKTGAGLAADMLAAHRAQAELYAALLAEVSGLPCAAELVLL